MRSAAVFFKKAFRRPVCTVWLAVFAAAFVLSAIIPPSQSPDENSHLARAYLLSRGHILLDRDPAGSGGAIDDGLLRFTDMFHEVGAGTKLDAALVDGVAPYIRWSGTESRRVYAGTGYYFPAIYLPQAIALAVGRGLDLTVAQSYQLTRLAVFAATAAMIAISITLIPPSFAVLGLVVMPMVVFQAVSATIDGLSIGLCMLAISCFLSLLRQALRPGGDWRFTVLCIAVFILAGSRAHALPMVLLPFVIAWQHKSRACFVAAIAVLFLTLAWTFFALVTVKDTRILRDVSSGQVLRYYLLRPGRFLSLLGETLSEKWRYYRDTFIGTLGYLDIYLPAWYQNVAAGALSLLALFSFKRLNTVSGEGVGRAALAVSAIASCILVFLALLATWTPFPSRIIDGVQGRYFHIPALLLGYALSGVPEQNKRFKVLGAVVFGFLLLLSIYITSTALLNRYWLQDRLYATVTTTPAPPREPLVFGGGDVLKATYMPPATGSMYSAAFELGTYFGRSNGELTLQVCGARCVSGRVDISSAVDNQYAYIGLDKPLPVVAGQPLHLTLTLAGSTHQVALWAKRKPSPALAVTMNGNSVELVPEFRVAIQ